MVKNNYYEAINGLRAYAAIGIIMMHIKANGNYELSGIVFDKIIPSFADFVFLFMAISAFSMCCGYYEKIRGGEISIDDFYKRRYVKIWPYFAMLVLLDILVNPSWEALYEAFADLTLCFALLPNANISVIGVGWTLGIIFLFYLLFPFFCFLLGGKKRACLSFCLALIFNILCTCYFFDENHVIIGFSDRSNFVYCVVYFIAGGLIYLHRDNLTKFVKEHHLLAVLICVLSIAAYYYETSTITRLVVYSALLVYALGVERKGILYNPLTEFLGAVSFEIYLCHMVIFRIFEKAGLLYFAGRETTAYLLTCLLVSAGAVLFSLALRHIVNIAGRLS